MDTVLKTNLELANKKAKEYDSSIKVLSKEGIFGRFLANLGMIFLTVLTLGIGNKGKKWKERFINNFLTTIGPWILVPKNFNLDDFYWILPHEARHVKQYRFFAFGLHPLLGFPGMLFVYALLPLPMFGAFGRVYLEMDAERARWKELLRIWKNESLALAILYSRCEDFANTVASSMYFYSMPTSFVKWYFRRKLEKIIHESL